MPLHELRIFDAEYGVFFAASVTDSNLTVL
jgi:hypothetical protein